MLVKICGLSSFDMLDAALDAGADMVGFVAFDKSPRHISLSDAQALGAYVAGRASKVLLTVDAGDAFLAAAIASLGPQVLQLHGSESPERVAAVRARFGLPVMKAIGVAVVADLAQTAAYESVADMLLLDAKPTPAAVTPGGNGAAFDWSLLRGLSTQKPWMLAGGLNPQTVAAALRATGAPGIDVSSGVETSPGVKDAGKIAAFVAEARSAAAAGAAH